jgi:hypothetical protein
MGCSGAWTIPMGLVGAIPASYFLSATLFCYAADAIDEKLLMFFS